LCYLIVVADVDAVIVDIHDANVVGCMQPLESRRHGLCSESLRQIHNM
jgi:hypothetical protein